MILNHLIVGLRYKDLSAASPVQFVVHRRGDRLSAFVRTLNWCFLSSLPHSFFPPFVISFTACSTAIMRRLPALSPFSQCTSTIATGGNTKNDRDFPLHIRLNFVIVFGYQMP